jgi:hypothetical protein
MSPLIPKQQIKCEIIHQNSSAGLNEASTIYWLTENRWNKHIKTKVKQ